MDPLTIVIGGTIANCTISASMLGLSVVPRIWTSIVSAFYYKRRFMLGGDEGKGSELCKLILYTIHESCMNLKRTMNITIVRVDASGQKHMISLLAPFPGEFVEIGEFWVQSVPTADYSNMQGFEIWYRESRKNEAYAWLENVFRPLPNHTHFYHPSDEYVRRIERIEKRKAIKPTKSVPYYGTSERKYLSHGGDDIIPTTIDMRKTS